MESTKLERPLGLALSDQLGCDAQAATRERPVLFSAPMVRALLAGTKTQTRRRMRVQPHDGAEVVCDDFYPTVIAKNGDEEPGPEVFGAWWSDGEEAVRCPYGKPGDRLWVRETWARCSEDGEVFHRADVGSNNGADVWQHNIDVGAPGYRWRPSIFMPRSASRVLLEITAVRVERLQAISEDDAIAEGCVASPFPGPWWQGYTDLGDGDLVHQQAIGETPPDWMIEPKRMRDHSGLGLS